MVGKRWNVGGYGCEQQCCRQTDAAVLLLHMGPSSGGQLAAGAALLSKGLRDSGRQTHAARLPLGYLRGAAQSGQRQRHAPPLLWKAEQQVSAGGSWQLHSCTLGHGAAAARQMLLRCCNVNRAGEQTLMQQMRHNCSLGS